jgi:hypothetical protein
MAAWVSVVTCAVKLKSLPSALNLVSVRPRSTESGNEARDQRLASTLDTLLKLKLFWFEPICWKRAAVLHRYLALNGTASTIVFGVRKEGDGKISGHAWLESNGKPILEAEFPNYTVTYRFPSDNKVDLNLSALSLRT